MAATCVENNVKLCRGGSWKVYDPTKPRRAPYISDEEWTKHKATIQHIHESGKSRAEMLLILKSDHAFHPSMGQLVLRLSKWELFVNTRPFARSVAEPRKNLTEDQMMQNGRDSLELQPILEQNTVADFKVIQPVRPCSPIALSGNTQTNLACDGQNLPKDSSVFDGTDEFPAKTSNTRQNFEGLNNTPQGHEPIFEETSFNVRMANRQDAVNTMKGTLNSLFDTILNHYQSLKRAGNVYLRLNEHFLQVARVVDVLAGNDIASLSDIARRVTTVFSHIAVLGDVLLLCGRDSDTQLALEIYQRLNSCFELMQQALEDNSPYHPSGIYFRNSTTAKWSPSLIAGWIHMPLYFEGKQLLKVHINHLQDCSHLSGFIARIRNWVICMLILRGKSSLLTHDQIPEGVSPSLSEERRWTFTRSLFKLLVLLFHAWDQESNQDFVNQYVHGCELCGTPSGGFPAWSRRFILFVVLAAAKFHLNKQSKDLVDLIEGELIKTVSLPDSEQWVRLASSLRIDARSNSFSQSNRHIFNLADISGRELIYLIGGEHKTSTTVAGAPSHTPWQELQEAEIQLMKLMVQGDLPRAVVFGKIRAYKKMESQLKLPYRKREAEYKMLQPNDLPYMLEALLTSMNSSIEDSNKADQMSLFSISSGKLSFKSFERYAARIGRSSLKPSSLRSVSMTIETSSSWSFGRVTGYDAVTRSSSLSGLSFYSKNNIMDIDTT